MFSILRRLAVGTTAVYVSILLVLSVFENQLVFHPAAAENEWEPTSADADIRDVYLRTAAGIRIHAWWCPHPDAPGAVLWCHHSSHNLSSIGLTAPEKLEQWHNNIGVSLLVFDYPGYGKSEGTPNETGCYAAADAAYDWLVHERKIAPEKILIAGKSLGTAVAVDLASRRDHRALVLVSPFTSLPDVVEACYVVLPARLLMRNRFNCRKKIKKCNRPVLIFHGTNDRRVPFHLGKNLFQCANKPKRFIRVDGARHGRSVLADFFPLLQQFLRDTTY